MGIESPVDTSWAFFQRAFSPRGLGPPTHPSPSVLTDWEGVLSGRRPPMGIESPVVILRSNTTGLLSTDACPLLLI